MKLYKATTYHPGSRQWNYHEATPEDIVAAFRELPLTRQMRAASDVVVEADARLTPDLDHDLQPWDAKGIRAVAARFDREDAEKAQRDQEVEELAQDLAESAGYSRPDNFAYQRARDLYAKGYRKQADDDWYEDAEQHRQAAEVEELAEILAIHVGGWDEDAWEDRSKPNVWYDHARRLIRVGYRKQADERVDLHDCWYDDPRMCAWPGHRKAQS